jgi:hypothetical protein
MESEKSSSGVRRGETWGVNSDITTMTPIQESGSGLHETSTGESSLTGGYVPDNILNS